MEVGQQGIGELPAQLARVGETLRDGLATTGWLRVLLLIAVFVGLGVVAERAFWSSTTTLRERLTAAPLGTPKSRAQTALARLVYGLATLLAFAVGSIGAFLALTWPPTLRSLVLGYLLAFLSLRAGMVVARLLCATGFLGGFTTFSAYSYEVISLWDKGRVGGAVLYALVSVLAAALALALAARWTRAWLS